MSPKCASFRPATEGHLARDILYLMPTSKVVGDSDTLEKYISRLNCDLNILLLSSGNLGRVDYITEIEYDIFIRPDTCNPRFRVWFYFTVENVKSDQRVIFNIVNFSKTKSLYREGMSPVVRSTSRPKW